jgi:hypothetical protein
MGLFFEILNSINDPHRQGSVEQLRYIILNIQQLQQQHQLGSDTMQKIVSAVGRAMQSVLRQNSASNTDFNELAAAGSFAAMPTVFPSPVQAQMVLEIVQQTGIEPDIIQAIVPSLLPLVCQIFQLGADQPRMNGHRHNHILATFLKEDQYGSADLGEILWLSGRFLHLASDATG